MLWGFSRCLLSVPASNPAGRAPFATPSKVTAGSRSGRGAEDFPFFAPISFLPRERRERRPYQLLFSPRSRDKALIDALVGAGIPRAPRAKKSSTIMGAKRNSAQFPLVLGNTGEKLGRRWWTPVCPTSLHERFFFLLEERRMDPFCSIRDEFGDSGGKGIFTPRVGGAEGQRRARASPSQALPLPSSFFFIFVTVLKPAARLGN